MKKFGLSMGEFFFSLRFSDAFALPSVPLAKRAHCSRFIPSRNNNCPDFLPESLNRFHPLLLCVGYFSYLN